MIQNFFESSFSNGKSRYSQAIQLNDDAKHLPINFDCRELDCVPAMPAHFDNDEKCDGSKI